MPCTLHCKLQVPLSLEPYHFAQQRSRTHDKEYESKRYHKNLQQDKNRENGVCSNELLASQSTTTITTLRKNLQKKNQPREFFLNRYWTNLTLLAASVLRSVILSLSHINCLVQSSRRRYGTFSHMTLKHHTHFFVVSLQALTFLGWLEMQAKPYDYVMHADDDSFVRLDLLMEYLVSRVHLRL